MPAGTVEVIVSYIGYQTARQTVTVTDGATTTFDLALASESFAADGVEITAQASGQLSAINQQLGSNSITNVVSADRIREVPDVNAAESIGRLPGVSIQRSGGEANKVVVRGLSPKYNNVTVNGVRVPSTGGSDRSVDLALISSNMLGGIEVLKALTPDRDADAIGGSIDLKLREAPAVRTVDLTVQGGYNRIQDTYGNYKVAATTSSRFWGDRLGAIANFSIDENDRSLDRFNGSYRQEGEGEEASAVLTNVNLREEAQVRNRLGASLVLDYRIPLGKIVANGFYNRLSGDQSNRSNQFDIENRNHDYSLFQSENTTSITTLGIRAEQTFRRIGYEAGFARTSSVRDSPNGYSWQFREESAFDTDSLGDSPTPLGTPLAAFNDLDNTDFLNLSISDSRSEENETTAYLDLKAPFRFGWLSGFVKTGAKYRGLDRFNDQNASGRGLYFGGDQGMRDLITEAFPELGLEPGAGRIPLAPFLDTYSRDNFLEGDYPLGYTINSDLVRQVTDVLRDDFQENRGESRRRDYEGDETLRAGYVMTQLNVGDWLMFMPGMRWENEESTYRAQFVRDVQSNQTPVLIDTVAERSNTFALPMVHLRVSPLSWLDVRLAYTETLARPDFLQYAPITFINAFGSFVEAGNPTLVPAKSINYDASVSVYQNKVGLLTFSAFRKEISNLIVPTRFPLIEGQGILPDIELPSLSGVPIVSTAVNNPFDATVEGFELDWQTNFWYLPQPLKGVVLGINYTRVTSDISVPRYELKRERLRVPPFFTNTLRDTVRTGRLTDQPAHIANVTLGYDLSGFSARVSMLYQTDVTSFFGNTAVDDNFTEEYIRWDVLVKQKVVGGAEVFLNLNNLTSRPDRSYRGNSSLTPTSAEYYGFTMDLGVRYRL